MLVIMHDNIELTTLENIDTPQVQMRLIPDLPKETIPFGLFRSLDVEPMDKVKDWFFTRMIQEKKVAYGKPPKKKEIDRRCSVGNREAYPWDFDDRWMVVKGSPNRHV